MPVTDCRRNSEFRPTLCDCAPAGFAYSAVPCDIHGQDAPEQPPWRPLSVCFVIVWPEIACGALFAPNPVRLPTRQMQSCVYAKFETYEG